VLAHHDTEVPVLTQAAWASVHMQASPKLFSGADWVRTCFGMRARARVHVSNVQVVTVWCLHTGIVHWALRWRGAP